MMTDDMPVIGKKKKKELHASNPLIREGADVNRNPSISQAGFSHRRRLFSSGKKNPVWTSLCCEPASLRKHCDLKKNATQREARSSLAVATSASSLDHEISHSTACCSIKSRHRGWAGNVDAGSLCEVGGQFSQYHTPV